jgi:hypothetical protein
MDGLHDDFIANAAKHAGCLPAVDVVGTRSQPGRDCPILIPVFKRAGWVPRPLDLPVTGIPVFNRVKRKDADDAPSGNGSYTRPKPDDDMEVPFT